jgi:hypothetical protein
MNKEKICGIIQIQKLDHDYIEFFNYDLVQIKKI